MHLVTAGARRSLAVKAAACLLAASAAGCGQSVASASSPAAATPAASVSPSAVPSIAPTPSASPSPVSSPSPVASKSPAAASLPAAGSIRLEYDDNAQVLVTAPSGRRVFIDVYFPAALPAPTADDILLVTHTHDDHFLPEYDDAFPGQTLSVRAGTIATSDVKVTAVMASHGGLGPDGSDYIFVIDVAGLRIVHFGDLGQPKLTDKQMATIGKADVAISQTWNDLSGMDAANHKGIDQMKQVSPLLFIPTHHDDDSITLAAKTWPAFYSEKNVITVSKATLPATTTMLVMGQEAKYYAKLLDLKPGKW